MDDIDFLTARIRCPVCSHPSSVPVDFKRAKALLALVDAGSCVPCERCELATAITVENTSFLPLDGDDWTLLGDIADEIRCADPRIIAHLFRQPAAELNNSFDAIHLEAIANATDYVLPCPALTFALAGRFSTNGWIKNAGRNSIGAVVITDVGRQALNVWKEGDKRVARRR